jgi:hypothetical protein
MLESLLITAFVEVSILPLSDTYAIRHHFFKVSDIDFSFSKSQFAKAFHNTVVPTACVGFLEEMIFRNFFITLSFFHLLSGPKLFTMSIRDSSRNVADIDSAVRIKKLTVTIDVGLLSHTNFLIALISWNMAGKLGSISHHIHRCWLNRMVIFLRGYNPISGLFSSCCLDTSDYFLRRIVFLLIIFFRVNRDSVL